VTDPSLLDDQPLPVVDRRDGTHLDRGECGPWPLNGPRRDGSLDEIDCVTCRIMARLQLGRGEHPGGTP
jgi:hypothetical protein